MIKKRLIACVLAGTMALSLAACSGGSVSSKDAGKDSGSDADTQTGVEQTAKPQAPPEDAPVGGQFVVRHLPGSLSPDMADGWSANATNTGYIRLMRGYALAASLPPTYDREMVWDDVVLKDHEEVSNEDGSATYTVTLNDNLKWSDGSDITANDYVFRMMCWSSPQFAECEGDATVGSILKGFTEFNSGESKIFSGIRLKDDYTFSFTVDEENLPNYYILADIGYEPAPMALIAPGVEIKDDGEGCYFTDNFTTDLIRETLLDPDTGYRYKPSVVCGPYKLKKVDMSSETVELEINEEYLGTCEGTKPHIQSIISKPVADETWRDEFEKGNVDFFHTTKGETIDSTLSKLESGSLNANYGIEPTDSVQEWRFACDFGPTKFEEVRRAFAYILDRDEMNKQLTGGYSTVVDGLTTAASTDYQATKDELESTLIHYSYDLDKAKEELVNGGWTLNEKGEEFKEGTDALRYKEVDGELMPLIIKWAYNETATSKLYNTVVPPEAEKVGMRLEGTKMDFSQLVNHMYREGVDATYNVFTCGVVLGEFPSWWYYFDDAPERMGLWNYYRISDPELKDVTHRMQMVTPGDTETYQKLFVEFQQDFNKKLPGIIMSTDTRYWFYNPKLKNYVPRPFDNWWFAVLDAYIEE